MAASRAALSARLRRARIAASAALLLVTAGLTAAVAGAIPGRQVSQAPKPDPFNEPLTAFPPVSAHGGPAPTTAAPIAVSGAS